jgi:hypothetical protein
MDLCEIPQGTFQRHPWEVARLRFFARVLRSHGVLARTHRVLDAGAGDGWFSGQLLRDLPADARIVCWDAHYAPEQLARFNAAGGAQSFTASWPEGRFDLLLLLDVLEHVEDDRGFLGKLVDALEPGAATLISVPAWQALYTEHDRRLKHFRRYAPGQALEVLRGSGLVLEAQGGLFHSLLAARGLAWAKEKLAPPAPSGSAEDLGTWRHGPLLTRAVQGALELDNRLSHLLSARHLDVPGLSWWALCRKPSS